MIEMSDKHAQQLETLNKRQLEIRNKLLETLTRLQTPATPALTGKEQLSSQISQLVSQVTTLKKDLDYIFKSTRQMADKLRVKYPDQYQQALIQVPPPSAFSE